MIALVVDLVSVMSFSTLALAGEPGESVLPLVKEAKSVMTVIVRPEEVAGCGCAASFSWDPASMQLWPCSALPPVVYGLQVSIGSDQKAKGADCDSQVTESGIACQTRNESQCGMDIKFVITQHNCTSGVQLESLDANYNNGNWRLMTSGDTFRATAAAKCAQDSSNNGEYVIKFRLQGSPEEKVLKVILHCESCKPL
jgi:hypothetical protein